MNLYPVYPLYDITPVRGQGSYVYDEKGTAYLDFYGGHAVISIGHSHPHYVSMLQKQIEKIGFYSNSIVNPLQQELADKLEAVSGISGFELFFINSGAEANENALKLASFYNGRTEILALHNSFHGRTSSAINVTHTGRAHQAPINKGIPTTYVDIDDQDGIVAAIHTGRFAAIIIECIQGVGGLDKVSTAALKAIRTACSSTDTVMIADEVQCGYARSGDFFAFQSADITPDIITMAKGMGNGFPIGGVLIDAVKMPAVTSRLGTTYGGSHLACAAGIAVIDVIKDEHLIKNATERGQELIDALGSLPLVKNIKGRGLMLGLEFDFPVSDLRKSLIYDYHLFTGSSSNPRLLRILPPLTITTEEVTSCAYKMKSALDTL